MAMEDTDSCSSRVQDTSAAQSRQQRQKLEVYNDVLHRLKETRNEEAAQPGFDDELWAHFNRLPARYALDVNVERAEDVLMHKRLLHLARNSLRKPAIEVHLVQVHGACDGNSVDSARSSSPPKETAHNSDHEDLAPDVNNRTCVDADSSVHVSDPVLRSMHEITISTDDKPKLLSQLTSLLADLGLNIQEAHAFSTTDGYSLDVFVVEGWPYERTEQLKSALEDEVVRIENLSRENRRTLSPDGDQALRNEEEYLNIPNDGTDVWEIEVKHLKFVRRIACGACGELYKGTYCSQDVAIKVLKPECVNPNTQRDFAQEVFIMRKVRHRNVVQFIGACTRPPGLCIVTEYMPGGSVYDQLHRQKGGFRLPALLRVALDVAKGMTYLHQNNIIHRDLKSANLLIDENDVVKVADFGVARVKSQSGIMTAETGTYRWMAPEIIEHKPYDHKADVFSFGVVLWELLTGKLPHEYLTPLQAAVGVVQKGLRPGVPKHTDPRLAELLRNCWEQNSCSRPDFSDIVTVLKQMAKEVGEEGGEEKRKEKGGSFLSVLRRSGR